MKNNTVITAGDMNYVWGIAMLVASMRKNGMDEPVIVGGKNLTEDAVGMLERLGGVRVIPVDTARSLTCMKPEIMLAADTDYITWVDGDGFFTGNCSSRLIPERPDEIHIRKRTSRENPLAFRNFDFGEDGYTIPRPILEAWRRDCGNPAARPRILQSCSACFLSVHKSARQFLCDWRDRMNALLPNDNIGVVDTRLKFYHQLDESVLNSLLCFGKNAPKVARQYRLDKDEDALFVHFVGVPKPWRAWTPQSIGRFDKYTQVADFAKNAGWFDSERLPFALDRKHKLFCRLAAAPTALKTKITNRLAKLARKF